MLGQGITSKYYHARVSMMNENNLHKFLSSIKAPINEKMESMPGHKDSISQYCKSE